MLIPIFRSFREFSHDGNACSRIQFPITVAYAITVHKSQGLTVPRAVLNITRKEFSAGLTYVAVSRVKTFDGVLFETSFDFERFKAGDTSARRMRAEDVTRRAAEHVGFILSIPF